MSGNIRTIKTVFTLIAINSIFCANVLSQTKVTTISSILDAPIEGQEVTLRGQIIEQQQGERDYIFTDGTNKITIELQELNFSYNPNTTLEITGIIDFESQHPEAVAKDPTPEKLQIKVNQLQVVTSHE